MNSSAFRKELRLVFWLSVAVGSSACGVDNRDLSAGQDAGPDTGATTAAGSGGKAGASGSGSGTAGTRSSGMGTGGNGGAGTGGGGADGGGCTNGDTRCSPTGVPQKCNAQGTGFDDQPPCQGDMVCDDGTGLCASRCMAGTKRCKPGASVIQQCDLQGDWQDTTTCPFACGGAGDATMCTGSCVPGTRTCGANNTPFLCDATGTSQMQTACPSACTGAGECTGSCKPNATRCAAGSTNRVETCAAAGSWGAATACTFVCDATTNDCGGECAPGAANRCSGSTVQSCDATGHWKDMTNCGTTPCSMGECRACTPSQKQCNAGKPQTCTAAGNWMDDQATACQFVCDSATGRCTGDCIPGSDACVGNTTKHCGANGLYGPATACTNICDMATGKCGGVCAPGAHQCSGSTAQTCGSNGQWGSNMACQYGCAAATGLCNTCTDEPMTTTCGGGKCGPTTNNCAHVVQCSTSCPGMGASCGGGGVSGVCGCSPQPMATTCSGKCGNVTNNCGQTVGCSTTCPTMQTCGGGGTPNVCGCTPQSMAMTCSGKCGNVANNCGQSVGCSLTCPTLQTCGGGGTPNVCGCTKESDTTFCSRLGKACGSFSGTDNCGAARTVANCGTCSGTMPACSNNTCVQCATDANCSGSTPTCDTLSHTCVCRRPRAGNLIVNPGFDTGLAGWGGIVPNVEPVWSGDDSESCPGSGSVHGANTDGAPDQCIPVAGGTTYFWGAKFKPTTFQDCQMTFYSDVGCSTFIQTNSNILQATSGINSWTAASTTVTAPANARSAFMSCFLFQGNMDQIYLNATTNAF